MHAARTLCGVRRRRGMRPASGSRSASRHRTPKGACRQAGGGQRDLRLLVPYVDGLRKGHDHPVELVCGEVLGEEVREVVVAPDKLHVPRVALAEKAVDAVEDLAPRRGAEGQCRDDSEYLLLFHCVNYTKTTRLPVCCVFLARLFPYCACRFGTIRTQ